MASKQTYECFQCKKNGFPDVRVYLDGKTEDGKTIYKDENMAPHHHKQQSQTQQQQPQAGPSLEKLSDELVAINEKLERLINLTAATAAVTTTRK